MTYYWRHFTTSPTETAAKALASARNGSFAQLPPSDRAKQLRALLLLSLQGATLTDAPGPLGDLGPSIYGDNDERNAAGAALARTAIVLAPAGSVVLDQDVLSWDDAPAITGSIPPVNIPGLPTDVGALPALAVVAIVSVAAAAACYVGTIVTQANHAIAFEQEKTKRLLNAHASSIDVIAKHIDREKLAGKTLAFEPEERTVLHSLEATQREVVAQQHAPLPTPFDGARDFGKALAESTRDIGKSTADALSSVVPIGLGLGMVWLMSK
jgi:hypothetical protein